MTPLKCWGCKTSLATLDYDEVHIWKVHLNRYSSSLEFLGRLLSNEELMRTQRFHCYEDKVQYILRHGILRLVIGWYLREKPNGFQFSNILNGKPKLSIKVGGEDLRFNMSHSRNIALYAIAKGREVGIDVEYIDSRFDFEQIVIQFFRSHEVDFIMGLPKKERREAFYRCWVRKEAVTKAMGSGISFELDQYEYSVYDESYPNSTTGMCAYRNNDTIWSINELVPHPHYISAIVAEGITSGFRLWETPLDIRSTRFKK